MRFVHPDLPDRRVRLAYCLNLHASDDFEELLAGIRGITLPLRDRLARRGEAFGVGLYLPARVATSAGFRPGGALLERLAALVRDERLDAFTYNAFPFGGFHASGLKRRVFEPTWAEDARLEFTLAVASAARELARASGDGCHVSISTHTGRFGAWEPGEEARASRNLRRAAERLAELERAGGPRIVLALEAEPRANAGDTRAAAHWHERLRAGADARGRDLLRRHVGTCLDCCHSAVEFEGVDEAVELATAGASPLGKLQFSSALALARPAERPRARAQLLALAEERYLHQVTGRAAAGFERVDDLPELAAALGSDPRRWLACDEWRCHFHVPVDLAGVGEGLETTRAHAAAVLERALARPERWGSDELHVEIETYTWDVLPRAARGAGELVDGLEREYRHVLALLAAQGWRRAVAAAD